MKFPALPIPASLWQWSHPPVTTMTFCDDTAGLNLPMEPGCNLNSPGVQFWKALTAAPAGANRVRGLALYLSMGSSLVRGALAMMTTCLCLAVSTLAAQAYSTSLSSPTAAALDGSPLRTLINQDRAAAGLPALAWSACLASVAQQNAQRIANQGYLSHTDGPTVDLGCGVNSTAAGENIAYISSGIDDVQVNTMYMNSPPHRANILGAYNFVGTAWVVAPNGYGYNAEEFLSAPSLAIVSGPWESLAGPIGSAPAVSSAAPGTADAFVRGTDNQLWHRAFDGTTWGSWQPLGGVLSAEPAAVSWGGRTDVFIRGSDLQLWHRWFDGASWSPWEALGGVLASAPAAASWGTGRLDVFVKGTDGHLWQRSYSGGAWTGWSNSAGAAGTLGSEPAVVSWGTGRIDVFIRGTDGQLWHLAFDGAWGSWHPLGGILGSGPAVTSGGAGHLDIFTRGTDRQLWHMSWTGTAWTNWTSADSRGAIFNDEPAAAASHNGLLQVLVRGTDNALWHTTIPAS
jgi:uncharacterized protein YkwD